LKLVALFNFFDKQALKCNCQRLFATDVGFACAIRDGTPFLRQGQIKSGIPGFYLSFVLIFSGQIFRFEIFKEAFASKGNISQCYVT